MADPTVIAAAEGLFPFAHHNDGVLALRTELCSLSGGGVGCSLSLLLGALIWAIFVSFSCRQVITAGCFQRDDPFRASGHGNEALSLSLKNTCLFGSNCFFVGVEVVLAWYKFDGRILFVLGPNETWA